MAAHHPDADNLEGSHNILGGSKRECIMSLTRRKERGDQIPLVSCAHRKEGRKIKGDSLIGLRIIC